MANNKWQGNTPKTRASSTLIKEVGAAGNDIVDSINGIPVSKLFAIIVLVLYGVLIYSKGSLGVQREDLYFLIVFVLFACVLLFFLYIGSFIHKHLLQFGFTNIETFVKGCFYESLIFIILAIIGVAFIKNFSFFISILNII